METTTMNQEELIAYIMYLAASLPQDQLTEFMEHVEQAVK